MHFNRGSLNDKVTLAEGRIRAWRTQLHPLPTPCPGSFNMGYASLALLYGFARAMQALIDHNLKVHFPFLLALYQASNIWRHSEWNSD